MYLVVIDKYSGPPQIMMFESKADFDREYQKSWGKIVDEGISRESAQKLYSATDPNSLEEKMPKDYYNVVFEYDETMGGAYGNRHWTQYESKEEYDSLAKNHSGVTIVAQGVTEEEALNLTSLTPEICRLMCAIEQAYSDNPRPEMELVNYAITNAKYAIAYDRKHIEENGLKRYDAKKYLEAFNKLSKDIRLSFKGASMSGIMLVCYNNLGQVL